MYVHTLTDDYHTLHYCCTDKCCLPQGTHTYTLAHTHALLQISGWLLRACQSRVILQTLWIFISNKRQIHTQTRPNLLPFSPFLSRSFIVPAFSLSLSFKLNHLFLLLYFNHFRKRMKSDEQKTSMTGEGDC